jgi:hypothetical protein
MAMVNPDVVTQISFQLSFLSVSSIISALEYHNTVLRGSIRELFIGRGSRRIADFLALSFVISIVAEIANTPITVYNFNNYTFYNVFTNMVASPLISFIILPFSMVSMLLYFVGLEFLLVIPASYAMDVVLMISDYVNAMENAIIILPSPCPLAMFFMIIGIVIFSILKTNPKHIGLLLYFVGILVFVFQKEADVFIDKNDRAIYFVNEKKKIFIYNPPSYNIKNTLKKMGNDEYTNITPAYRDAKYLTFYKNGKRLRINLRTLDFYDWDELDGIKDRSGFVSVYM